MHLDSLAEVARGGMGSVELARVVDGRLAGHILAVKRLHANIAEDPEFVSMFLDEAWMTAALKHNNVAQVMAWGNDDKGMFLAIELVQGVSLSRLIKEAQLNQEPFAERTVAYICSQICGALVGAHTLSTPDGTPLGLVHRDLTPANILISFDGVVKIIDFGIAKAEERISHTRTGQLKGKPAYMAPEQQRGAAVDARADLFAFGVLMFEMLAGRRPWTAKGAFDVMMEISNDPHPDLGDLRKGLNPEFVAIAHKCLEKKADDRIQTAAEIKARLDGWLHAKGFSADDAQSLANFVLRNCQPQVLWWQEALRGEHAKKKKPTFKELEEKIDEERERQAKAARKAAAPPPPPRPAAGMPGVNLPPGRLSGTVPMPAYGGPTRPGGPDSGVPPSSGNAGPPSPAPPVSSQPPSGQPISGQPISGQPISGQPISGQPASGGPLSAQPLSMQPLSAQPISGQPISGLVPPSQPAGSARVPRTSLMGIAPSPLVPSSQAPKMGSGQFPATPWPSSAGTELIPQQQPVAPPPPPPPPPGPPASAATEFLPVSPFGQQQPASQRFGGTVMMPEVPKSAAPPPSVSAYAAPSPHSGVTPAPTVAVASAYESGTVPMSPGLAMANTTQPMPPAEMLAAMSASQGVVPATVTMEIPKGRGRRSRLPLVLALMALVLGGAGAGLWFFGDRIGIDLGGGGSPRPVRAR
jgi:serine/threonine-protein kinase